MATTPKIVTRAARRITAIRAALIEGEHSGEPAPFDVKKFQRRMAAAHAARAL